MSGEELRAALDEIERDTRGAVEKGGDFTDGAEWVVSRLRTALAAPSTPEPSGPPPDGSDAPSHGAWPDTFKAGYSWGFQMGRAAPSTPEPSGFVVCGIDGCVFAVERGEGRTMALHKSEEHRAAPSTPEPSGPDCPDCGHPFDAHRFADGCAWLYNGDARERCACQRLAAPSTEPALDVELLANGLRRHAAKHARDVFHHLCGSDCAEDIARLAESQR